MNQSPHDHVISSWATLLPGSALIVSGFVASDLIERILIGKYSNLFIMIIFLNNFIREVLLR